MYIKNKEKAEAMVFPHGENIYELIGHKAGGSSNYSVAYVEVLPGKTSLPHLHGETEESYYILKGKATIKIDNEIKELAPGDIVVIPINSTHVIKNVGETTLEFLAICNPAWTPQCSKFTN